MANLKNLIVEVLLVSLLMTQVTVAQPDRREIDSADANRMDAWIDRELPDLIETYRHFHAHP
jgi:hypothetical protein